MSKNSKWSPLPEKTEHLDFNETLHFRVLKDGKLIRGEKLRVLKYDELIRGVKNVEKFKMAATSCKN